MSIGTLLGRAFTLNTEQEGSYYIQKPNSNILQPFTYSKANRHEERKDKDQRKQAMINDIMTTFLNHSIPSWEAMDILRQLQDKVISYSKELDLRYYREESTR